MSGANRRPPMRAAALLAAVAVSTAAGCGAVKRCGYAGWGREAWQQSDRVVEALAVAPGSRVADLGAGGGFFTFRLADAVGAEGEVYAVDVDPDMTEYLEDRVREEGRDNVSVVLAPYDDPKLPVPVDLIFTCNTYHHIEGRVAYFRNARRYLRPGGRVAVIEYRDDDAGFWHPGGHSTPPAAIRDEMEEAGYRLVAEHDWLERQGFLVFAPQEG